MLGLAGATGFTYRDVTRRRTTSAQPSELLPVYSLVLVVANREVSLYVITYENPYVVRAGERGQLSYVNLSTDLRRKAVSYVGSSVGLFEIFFRIFRICPWQRSSRAKHKVHIPYTTCKIKRETWFRFMVHAAGASCNQRVSKATRHV